MLMGVAVVGTVALSFYLALHLARRRTVARPALPSDSGIYK
jgi:hypothetical protein